MPMMTEVQVPRADDAEAALVGAVLLQPDQLPIVQNIVGPHDFYLSTPEEVFRLFVARADAGEGIDQALIADAYAQRHPDNHQAKLDVVAFAESCPMPSNAAHYAREVRSASLRRAGLDKALELVKDFQSETPPEIVAEFGSASFAEMLPGSADSSRLIPGDAFALDVADAAEAATWGIGSDVLAVAGEPTLIAATDGTGKTTTLLNLALARAGLRPEVLGFPVKPAQGLVLYVAADRPQQAARSLQRMVTEDDRPLLHDGLLVHRGAPPFSFIKEPRRSAQWAKDLGASDMFLDSLGAIVPGLKEDDAGSAVASAFAECSAEGVEVWAAHHTRKLGDHASKPTLEDLYGSRWITAGAGSVVLLAGQPGDLVVDVHHLKSPSDLVPRFRAELDTERGTLTRVNQSDLLSALRSAQRGLTSKQAAEFASGSTPASREKKARRELGKLVASGFAVEQQRERNQASGVFAPAVWFAVTDRPEP